MTTILPGLPHSARQAVAVAHWQSLPLTVYLSANALVILGSCQSLLQTIYHEAPEPLLAVAVNEATGQIAVSTQAQLRIYEEHSHAPGGRPSTWAESKPRTNSSSTKAAWSRESRYYWSLASTLEYTLQLYSANSPRDSPATPDSNRADADASAAISLSWGQSSELLVSRGRYLLLYACPSPVNHTTTTTSPPAAPEPLWSKKLADPVQTALLSHDSAYIASVGRTDSLVKLWHRTTFSSTDVRFQLSYLRHPSLVTRLQWRRPRHPEATTDALLYTWALDSVVRVWTCASVGETRRRSLGPSRNQIDATTIGVSRGRQSLPQSLHQNPKDSSISSSLRQFSPFSLYRQKAPTQNASPPPATGQTQTDAQKQKQKQTLHRTGPLPSQTIHAQSQQGHAPLSQDRYANSHAFTTQQATSADDRQPKHPPSHSMHHHLGPHPGFLQLWTEFDLAAAVATDMDHHVNTNGGATNGANHGRTTGPTNPDVVWSCILDGRDFTRAIEHALLLEPHAQAANSPPHMQSNVHSRGQSGQSSQASPPGLLRRPSSHAHLPVEGHRQQEQRQGRLTRRSASSQHLPTYQPSTINRPSTRHATSHPNAIGPGDSGPRLPGHPNVGSVLDRLTSVAAQDAEVLLVFDRRGGFSAWALENVGSGTLGNSHVFCFARAQNDASFVWDGGRVDVDTDMGRVDPEVRGSDNLTISTPTGASAKAISETSAETSSGTATADYVQIHAFFDPKRNEFVFLMHHFRAQWIHLYSAPLVRMFGSNVSPSSASASAMSSVPTASPTANRKRGSRSHADRQDGLAISDLSIRTRTTHTSPGSAVTTTTTAPATTSIPTNSTPAGTSTAVARSNSHPAALRLHAVWTGHSAPIRKMVRNYSGHAIVSRTETGETILWHHTLNPWKQQPWHATLSPGQTETGHPRSAPPIPGTVVGDAMAGARSATGPSAYGPSASGSLLTRNSMLPAHAFHEHGHIHRISVLRKGRFVVFLHHETISLWDCRAPRATLLAKLSYHLPGKALCLLILPRRHVSHHTLAHLATISSTQQGLVWEIQLPSYSSPGGVEADGTPPFQPHTPTTHSPQSSSSRSSLPTPPPLHERQAGSIREFCRFELPRESGHDDLAYVLPVDPAGLPPVTPGFLDVFARDVAISYTNSGRVSFWTARVQAERDEVGWLCTSSTETGIVRPSRVSGSTLKKAVLADASRAHFSIWDIGGQRLEYTNAPEAGLSGEDALGTPLGGEQQDDPGQDVICDLDWTSTPDAQSILAVGYQSRLVLFTQLRFDYLNKGPAWAPIREISIRHLTPHPIGDSTWLGNGHLVIGAGHQLFAFDRSFTSSDDALVTSLRLPARSKDRRADLFEVVQRLNGTLPIFHPQFLGQCILVGKTQAVKQVLVALHRTLQYHVEGETMDSYLGLDPDIFYLDTTVDEGTGGGEGNQTKQKKQQQQKDIISLLSSHQGASSSSSGSSSPYEDQPFSADMAASIHDRLTRVRIPQLSGLEQMQLADLVECAGVVEQQRRSLDENGARFLFFFRQQVSRAKRGGASIGTQGERTDPRAVPSATSLSASSSSGVSKAPAAIGSFLSWREFTWAFHSESQDILTDVVARQSNQKMAWASARESGLFVWLRDRSAVLAQFEQIARNEYNGGGGGGAGGGEKDPIRCSLFYLALGKKTVLQGLWRMAHGHPEQAATQKLLARNFDEPRWRTAALKNAYALRSKRRFFYAAAFFLLGGRLADAVHVCVHQLGDWQLGLAIARVYEGDDGPQVQRLLRDVLLPRAADEGNRWMASWIFWSLHRRDMAVRALLTPVHEMMDDDLDSRGASANGQTPMDGPAGGNGPTALHGLNGLDRPGGGPGHHPTASAKAANVSGGGGGGGPSPCPSWEARSFLTDDPALLVLYRQLRDRTLQTLRGAAQISPSAEWRFLMDCVRLYDRMGCDLLALDAVRNWAFSPSQKEHQQQVREWKAKLRATTTTLDTAAVTVGNEEKEKKKKLAEDEDFLTDLPSSPRSPTLASERPRSVFLGRRPSLVIDDTRPLWALAGRGSSSTRVAVDSSGDDHGQGAPTSAAADSAGLAKLGPPSQTGRSQGGGDDDDDDDDGKAKAPPTVFVEPDASSLLDSFGL